jgi:chromate transporter
MVIPSFVIIYLVSTVLDNFLLIPVVANAFKGIKIGVGLLILRVAIQMRQKLKPKPQPRIIAGCAFAVMLAVNFLSLKFSTITLTLISGAVGLGIFLAKERKGGGAK